MDIKLLDSSPNIKSPAAANVCRDSIARRDKHNQRRREKKQGIFNLSSWHVSRLRALQEKSDDDYAIFIQYIKWKGGTVPQNNGDEIEYLDDLCETFDSLNGYEFFRKHNLDLPPNGISIENTFFD